jgi:hypothetical protein
MAYDPTGGYPTLDDVRAWLQTPATVLSDAQLDKVAGAAQIAQQTLCAWTGDLPDDAYQAFLRRCAREVAARGVPLGMIGVDAEFGAARLSNWDAVIEGWERPLRVGVLG